MERQPPGAESDEAGAEVSAARRGLPNWGPWPCVFWLRRGSYHFICQLYLNRAEEKKKENNRVILDIFPSCTATLSPQPPSPLG